MTPYLKEWVHVMATRMNFARARVVCRAHDRQVFQVRPKTNVTLRGLRDCVETSQTLRPVDQRAYFLSEGIDYDNYMKYYDFVVKMNTVLSPPRSVLEQASDTARIFLAVMHIFMHILQESRD
jgi:hypothetical protein